MPNIFDNAEKKYMEDRVRGILWKKLAMIKTQIFAATKKNLRPTKWKTIYLCDAPLLKLAWQICRVRNLNVFLKQKMRNIFFHTHLSHTLKHTHTLSLSFTRTFLLLVLSTVVPLDLRETQIIERVLHEFLQTLPLDPMLGTQGLSHSFRIHFGRFPKMRIHDQ